jgi:mono/diheme cytochrome c family protein
MPRGTEFRHIDFNKGPIMHLLLLILMVPLATTTVAAQPVPGLDPAAQRGLVIARTHCARCHSIDKVTDSPLKIAPPFRTLHKKYPVEHLQESLAEGLSTGHPTMPEFRFAPDQVNDFIAYLKTLER